MTDQTEAREIFMACSDRSKVRLGRDPRLVRFSRILESETPCVVLAAPAITSYFILAEDGSMLFLDGEAASADFDALRAPGETPLFDGMAQADVFDLRQGLREQENYTMIMGPLPKTAFFLFGASRGARALLGLDETAALEEVATAARAAGGDPERLFAAFEAYNDELDDPLFNASDETNWTTEQCEAIEATVLDVFFALPAFEGGGVLIRARRDGDETAEILVDYNYDADIYQPALALLNALIDFDQTFVGTTWDYNDGASGRKSGYTDSGAEVFEAEVDAPTAHERLSARRRIRDALTAKGHTADEIDALMKGQTA